VSEQPTARSKKTAERSADEFEGLSPGERVRLEESMRRNERLMKRLAEM